MAKYEQEDRIQVPRFEEKNGFYTTSKRSKLMSRIKGKNTSPEIIFRKALWRKGVRYKLDYAKLPGKPDIAVVRYKLAIFIDGEFWHGFNWEEKKPRIKSNRDFWIPKIERNMQRDRENNKKLNELGWRVVRFWDHEVKKDLPGCIDRVLSLLHENV